MNKSYSDAINKLLDATEKDAVEWSVNADNGGYSCTRNNQTIHLRNSFSEETGDSALIFSVETDSDENIGVTVRSHESGFDSISELYGLAGANAHKVDDKLEQFFSGL